MARLPFAPGPALLLPLLLWACTALTAAALASARKYELTVSNGLWSPDCVQKQVVLINGAFPGPPLIGKAGEVMEITVNNQMTHESMSIHWHGIRMLNNNYNDGTSYVTQCPIGPKQTLVYRFLLEKAGTFMYHGHLGIAKTAGLFGLLIAQETKASVPFPVPYAQDLPLVLTDWYHLSIDEQIAVLQSNQWVGRPQSLLLNGRGEYNCSLVPSGLDPIVGDVKLCNATAPQCGREVFLVETGKTYRLRIGNLASLVPLNLVLEGHTMTVIAADSHHVVPFTIGAEGLDTFTGQTYDIIFTADQPVGNYWVRTALFGYPYGATPYGLGIIRYKGAPEVSPTTAPPPMRDILNPGPALAQALKYKGQAPDTPPLPKLKRAPRLQVLVGALQIVDGLGSLAINNVSLDLPATPYALGIAAGRKYLYKPTPGSLKFTPWNYSLPAPTPAMRASNYYTFRFNSYVDILLQMTANPFGGPEYHPWHMHGHDFWILGQGFGTYNATKDKLTFNIINPPYRNTVGVMPGGWAYIRFKADNPGAWLFHCHIEYHHVLGMQIVFLDGYVLPFPAKTRKCGVLY